MKTLLIRNEAGKIQKDVIVGLHFNLAAVKIRQDTLEGRAYTVVPMVMLVEGVHNGSGGPLYYSESELGKTPQAWDHKPVVVYHPERNGQGISACRPEILNNRKVGLIMNTAFKKGRLTSEAWIDMERAAVVDERIVPAIQNQEMMELSTGVFVDVDSTPGEWKGEKYQGLAMNYRPDHLALLPDKVGACSLKDGAGFVRNEGRPDGFVRFIDEMRKQFGGAIENEMSHSNTSAAIRALLDKKLPVAKNGPIPWIADVYSNFFIYEWDGKLFRLSYTASDTGEVSLGDETPKEVRRVTEYRTVSGAFVGNLDQDKEINMDKTKIIVAILAANAGWSEKDKPTLEAMSDKQLEIIHKGITPPTQNNQPAPDPKKVLVDGIIGNGTGWTEADREKLNGLSEDMLKRITTQKATSNAPVQNQQTTQQPNVVTLTAEQFMAAAPPAIRDALQTNMKAIEDEKTSLVDNILKNPQNQFTKEELAAYGLPQLRKLANLVKSKAPAFNFSGLAPVTENAQGSDDDEEEPVLNMPAMNFERAKK